MNVLGGMNILRAILTAFALLVTTSGYGQLMQLTLQGTLSLEHHPFPWFPVTHVSGPHAFRVDAVYDVSLPSFVNEDEPDSRLFFPEGGNQLHELRFQFDQVNWSVPLREIAQAENGDFGLLYYDRFSVIRSVIHFGAGAITDLDRLITPEFFNARSSDISGELDGFLIGVGGMDGTIHSVDATWFAPVPESKSYAGASALLIIGLVYWRKRASKNKPAIGERC